MRRRVPLGQQSVTALYNIIHKERIYTRCPDALLRSRNSTCLGEKTGYCISSVLLLTRAHMGVMLMRLLSRLNISERDSPPVKGIYSPKFLQNIFILLLMVK